MIADDEANQRTAPPPARHVTPRVNRARRGKTTSDDIFREYFWFIVKNVIGWIFILASPVLGVVVPGPGGLPMFLIGFAMVTFPGKRKITSRVMRGIPLDLTASVFTFFTAFVSIAATVVAVWAIHSYWQRLVENFHLKWGQVVGLCLIAFAMTWLTMRGALQVTNWILLRLPKVRRFIRRSMKKMGIHLLPSRRTAGSDEIIAIDQAHLSRARRLWTNLRPWLQRIGYITVTVIVISWLLKPLAEQWWNIQPRILQSNTLLYVPKFFIAAGLFAGFLWVFRSLSWWSIVRGMGHTLPLLSAVRVWSMSEVARYVPGVKWQMIGRVFLTRPYNLSPIVCSASHVLELCIFLLTNLFLGGLALFWFGHKLNPSEQVWMYSAFALVPFMVVLIWPSVFYGLANLVLKRMKMPSLGEHFSGLGLLALTGWMGLGLIVQSLAGWILVKPWFILPMSDWWIFAASYSIAWCAGFLAFWAPAGVGVREVVFVILCRALLPDSAKSLFPPDGLELTAMLVLISLILRAWTIVGELAMVIVAVILDVRGTVRSVSDGINGTETR